MSESVDSEYIDIEIFFEFSCIYGEIKRTRRGFTIYEDGDIMFDIDLSPIGLFITTNEILEIGRISKLYRDRRYNYLQKEK